MIRFAQPLPRPLRLLPLVAGLTAAGLAHGDPNPYYIGASQGISHVTNVFGVPDGVAEADDTLYLTSLLAGIDQPIGRERLYGDLALRHSKYADNSVLDNTGYGASLGLDWATINNISGTFKYAANRTLAQFNADGGPVLLNKNLETSQQFDAIARIGVVTRLTGQVAYSYRKLNYSAAEEKYREFDQNTFSAGVNYATSSALTFGVGARHGEGKYPSAFNGIIGPTGPQTSEDDFKRNDVYLTADWTPSGASRLNAQLNFGKEDHSLSNQTDFSGTTGTLSWDWRPTGKLQFVTSLSRDTGAQSTFYERQVTATSGTTQTTFTTSGTGDQSRVTNFEQLVAKYAATAKISLDATLQFAQRQLSNTDPTLGAAGNISGNDRTNQIALGAHWTPTRNIEVGCTYSRLRRTSDETVLSQPYRTSSVGCYGQFLLQ